MIKRVEHVALMATDMDKSIDYYCSLFGFRVRARGEGPVRELAFLEHPNQPSFEIELIRDLKPGESYSEVGLVNHLAFTVENIEEAVMFYKNKGVDFVSETPKVAVDGGKTVFFYGPNRELLQFVEPNKERKALL